MLPYRDLGGALVAQQLIPVDLDAEIVHCMAELVLPIS
jgi:hypothetical protein